MCENISSHIIHTLSKCRLCVALISTLSFAITSIIYIWKIYIHRTRNIQKKVKDLSQDVFAIAVKEATNQPATTWAVVLSFEDPSPVFLVFRSWSRSFLSAFVFASGTSVSDSVSWSRSFAVLNLPLWTMQYLSWRRSFVVWKTPGSTNQYLTQWLQNI